MKTWGKKGQGRGLQYQLFLAAEVLFGLLIAISFLYYANYGITYSNEAILANDVANSVSALISSPSPLSYYYEGDTEEYLITVTEEEARVSGFQNEGRAAFIQHDLVEVIPTRISQQPTMLMNTDGGKVSFTTEDANLAELCQVIDYDEEGILRVSVSVGQPSEYAETLRENLESALASQDNVEVVEDDIDVKITVARSSTETFIATYAENSETTHKLACNTLNLVDIEQEISSTGMTGTDTESTVTILSPSQISPGDMADIISRAMELTTP